MKQKSIQDQKVLALWATDCAERVLPYFEKTRPRDKRPRKAIKAARDWVKGRITVGEARKAALAAHAAARTTRGAAQYAARSAGHAAATAHVASHSFAAAYYAEKATGRVTERYWQYKRLLKRFSIKI